LKDADILLCFIYLRMLKRIHNSCG